MDIEEQMTAVMQGKVGKRLPCPELIGPEHTRQPGMLNAVNT